MQTTGAPSTIRLKSQYGRKDEFPAYAALSPGHLLQVNSTGEVLKHNMPGGRAERLFALEDALQGKTVTGAYAAADPVDCLFALPGDVVYARLATGNDVAKGDKLGSNGDGALKKISANGSTLLYSNTAESAEHENTIVAADFDKTFDIPANSLQVGDVIHIQANVTVNDNNSTDTLTLLLTLEGVTIVTTGAVDVADLDIGFFDAYLIIRTIGAAGTYVASGLVGLGVPGTVTGKAFHLASTAINTTIANRVAVNADWSVAHADNEVSLTGLVVELLRPGEALAIADEAVDNDPGTAEVFIRARLL